MGRVRRSIRVLLVDDHPVVIEGLRAVLDQEADISVVGDASNGSEAIVRTRELSPDVVLLDMRIAPPAGADLVTIIRETSPSSAVVILTSVPDDEDLVDCVAAGARSYLLKGTSVTTLTDTIRRIADGESVIEPSMLGRLVERLAGGPKPTDQVARPILTEREHQVLSLVVHGSNNREIASELFISLGTVKAHLGALYQKIGVRDRTSAAVEALKRGLVEIPDTSTADSRLSTERRS